MYRARTLRSATAPTRFFFMFTGTHREHNRGMHDFRTRRNKHTRTDTRLFRFRFRSRRVLPLGRWCPWAKRRAWWAATCTGRWAQGWARTRLWWPSSLVSGTDGQRERERGLISDLTKMRLVSCYLSCGSMVLRRELRLNSNSWPSTRFTVVKRRTISGAFHGGSRGSCCA